MANEWQSLLQAAPNNANFNLVKSFQDSYGTAQEQKKTAYEQFRIQKAQDIASQSTRDDGSMDWDKMFQLGRDAGIGLDTFNQVHKMQTDRRASEIAVKQGQMALGAMGYDNTDWDNSARPISYIPAGKTPYVAPDEAQQSQYDFITNPSQPEQSTQAPAAPAATATPAPVVSTPAQTDINPSENEDGAIRIVGQEAPATKAPIYELPEAPAIDRDYSKQGYYNELWRSGRNKEQGESIGAGLVGPGARQLTTEQMSVDQLDRFSNYADINGIKGTPAEQLAKLEDMAVASIPVPKLNPMVGMLSRDDMAKEYGRYEQAKSDYLAKVQEARNKVAQSIGQGNYTVLDKMLAQSANRIAQENLRISDAKNRREASQVEWGDVFESPFESPAEKAKARDASAAAKGIASAISKLSNMDANNPAFPALRMAISKDIMIAYGLPVTEGVMSELEGLVKNGMSIGDISNSLQNNGWTAATANIASQFATDMFNLRSPTTIAAMGRSAQEFARNRYEQLGIKQQNKFDELFPISKDSWQDKSTTEMLGLRPTEVAPTKPKPAPASSGKKPSKTGKPLEGVSF